MAIVNLDGYDMNSDGDAINTIMYERGSGRAQMMTAEEARGAGEKYADCPGKAMDPDDGKKKGKGKGANFKGGKGTASREEF